MTLPAIIVLVDAARLSVPFSLSPVTFGANQMFTENILENNRPTLKRFSGTRYFGGGHHAPPPPSQIN